MNPCESVVTPEASSPIYVGPADFFECAVAQGAAGKGGDYVQLLDDETQLLLPLQADGQTQAVQLAGGEQPAFEEPAVGGEDDAAFGEGMSDEVAIIDPRRVARIDTQHAQPAGHAAAHGVAGELERLLGR